MPTNEESVLDQRELQSLGVLLPIRLSPLSFFSGRHPLGRAGEGMRFLRTRPYESGQDNPRDIDKFSPPGEYRINEWEAEAQASVMIYADISASMLFGPKAALLHLTLLQLTYSLWRASDRVRTTLYHEAKQSVVAKRNLRSQLEQLIVELRKVGRHVGRNAVDVLTEHGGNRQSVRDDLLFIVSDFCPPTAEAIADDFEDWRKAIRFLPGDVVPVTISFELAAGQRGAIRLWDAERRQHRLTLLTASRIAAINAAERARVEELEGRFRSLGLDYLVLRRDRDVYPEFARLARWRRRRRN
ncbi:MAG: hypothetical protein ACE5KS_01710 [Woeseiaceae bacterium]